MINYKGYTIWYNSAQGWMIYGCEYKGGYTTLRGCKAAITRIINKA